MPKKKHVMGLDIGGTGIKGAIVDIGRAELVSDRVRFRTPQPSTPEAVMKTAAKVRKKLGWSGRVGCGFPGLIRSDVVTDAPNLDRSWVGFGIVDGLRRHLGQDLVAVLNDADAAGVAEMRFGAGRKRKGTVVVITLGTGIGTAVFRDGILLPYTEFGHLEIGGEDAELRASERARIVNKWTWKKWAKHLDTYLSRLEYLLGVELFILGGGGSKKADKFLPHLEKTGCEIVTAKMGNLAGIVGAAMFAAEQ
jgi:polyphosphate glucokinase